LEQPAAVSSFSAAHDLAHLAKRFATSLVARPLSADEQAWVDAQLLPGEQALWRRMSTADRRHAYEVGQRVMTALADRATRPVLAAALLHDVGKVESGLGTLGRSAATVLSNVGIRPSKVAAYRAHNEIGRRLLEQAGSDVLTSTWAYEHERPMNEWTIDPVIAGALHAADDD
jgi:hypothetical protein